MREAAGHIRPWDGHVRSAGNAGRSSTGIITEEAKRPTDFTDAERAYLQKFRDELTKTQKPASWGNYYSNDREFRVRPLAGKTNRRG